MASSGAVIAIPEQFQPKADIGLSDLFGDTAQPSSAERERPELSQPIFKPAAVPEGDTPAELLVREERQRNFLNLSLKAAENGGGSIILSGSAAVKQAAHVAAEHRKAHDPGMEEALRSASAANQARLAELDEILKEAYEGRDRTLAQIKELEGRMHMKDGQPDWAAYGAEAGIKKNPGETDAEYARRCRQEIEEAEARGETWVPDDIRKWEELQRVLYGWNYQIYKAQQEHDELTGITSELSTKGSQILDRTDISTSEKNEQLSDVLIRAKDARHEQKNLEAVTPFVDTTGVDSKYKKLNEMNNTEDEVAEFSKRIAQIEKIPNETERLKAEKQLVDSMSMDAQDVAASDPDYGHIFDEGYFDKLGQTTSAAAATPLTGPTSPGPTG